MMQHIDNVGAVGDLHRRGIRVAVYGDGFNAQTLTIQWRASLPNSSEPYSITLVAAGRSAVITNAVMTLMRSKKRWQRL
ncbi:hypothetical protein MJK72_18390 [Klebsiella pneumoniae]|nr:hypothetical protein MJK72_18390 [Klebsiella pneumoniae]